MSSRVVRSFIVVTAALLASLSMAFPTMAQSGGSQERQDGAIQPRTIVQVASLPDASSPRPPRPGSPLPVVTVPVRRPPDQPGANQSQPGSTPAPEPNSAGAPSTRAATILTSFAGLNGSESGAHVLWDPPDTQVAAGPSHVFELVNSRGRVYTKTGSVLSTFDLNDFFSLPQAGIGSQNLVDPIIRHDHATDRWLLFGISTSSDAGHKHIAVSTTNNPLGSFCIYDLPTSQRFPDYDKVGFSDDKVVITANDFQCCGGGSAYVGTEFIVFNKSQLLSCGSTSYNYYQPDQGFFTISPAISLSSTSTLFMASVSGSPTTTMRIWSLIGTPGVGAGTIVTTVDKTIRSLANPPEASQLGSSHPVDTFYNGIQSAVYRDGSLWVAGGSACTPSGDSATRACLRFIEILASGLAVHQDFDYGVSGAHLYFPAIQTDSGNNLIAVFSRSSSTEYPSVYTSTRVTSDPLNTMGAPVLVKAGEGPTGSDRWGDYSGAGIDPSDQTAVWVAAQYERTGGEWGTWISRVSAGNAGPANDSFSSATTVSSFPAHYTATTTGATTETGEPTTLTGCSNAGASLSIGKTVWYRVTSPSTTTVTVSLDGSSFDTVLAVYTGSSLGGLTKIACDDDGVRSGGPSKLSFSASAGTAYYVQAGGWSGAAGSLTVDISAAATPADPRQEGAVQVGGTLRVGGRASFTISVKNYGGTATPALHPYIEGNNSASQFWRADGSQPPSAVIQPGQTQAFTVYQDLGSSGTWTSNGIFLWDNDRSTYWEPLPANGQNQQFSFQVSAAGPANDAFGSATSITSLPAHFTLSNANATTEASEPTSLAGCPNGSGTSPIGSTVWYKLTPSSSMTVTVTTAGSDFDTALEVYTGSALAALTRIACDDDGVSSGGASRLSFSASGGTTYYIQAGGWSGRTGNLVVDVSSQTANVDLELLPFTPPASGTVIPPGEEYAFCYVMRNNGTVASGGFNVELSLNGQVTRFAETSIPANTMIGTTDCGVGSHVYFIRPVAGLNTVTMKLDWDNRIAEANENNNQQSIQFCVPLSACGLPAVNLGITVTDAPDPVVAGQELKYQIGVRNSGLVAASSVTLTITGYDATSLLLGCPGVMSVANGTITCDLGPFNGGASLPLILTTRPSAAGTTRRTFTVSSTEADGAPADNTVTVDTTVTRAPVRVQTARTGDGRLQVTLTAGTGSLQSVQFGDPTQRPNVPTNAVITVVSPANGPSRITGGYSYQVPPGTTTVTFIIAPSGAGAVTVPMVITDGAGPWKTFVGAGQQGL